MIAPAPRGPRPRLVLALAAAVALAAGLLAVRLELRTAITELLPTREPAVVALERTRNRIGDLSLLLVGIRSPDRAANLRYAEALTVQLQQLPRQICELATYHVRDLRQFLAANRWLYLSEDDLTQIRDRLRRELVRHKNPFAADLGLEDDAAPDDVAGLTAALEKRVLLDDRFPGGVFAHGDYVWIATLPAGDLTAENLGDQIHAQVRRFVHEHPPAQFHPAMQVMEAGPVMATLHNREAVERDLVLVTVICVLLISASIALYFRSWRWVLVVVAPAALGTLCAFALAELAFGNLNSSTAFLGSIILGNGINYALVLGARYRERRRTLATTAAMQAAVADVWRSTLAAAGAASVAYASLLVTGFRGFSQFGLMGAAGALLCWGATFTLLPALVALLDPGPSASRVALAAGRAGTGAIWARVARLVVQRPQWTSAVTGLVTLAALLGMRHFIDRPFEYDFHRLSTDVEQDQEYKRFDENLDQLFSHWHSPTVLLADRPDQVESLRQAIRRKDADNGTGRPFIGQIVTIYDVLPGPPEVQRRKLALLADIRRLADDPAVELLDGKTRQALAQNLPPAGLRALGPTDLPPLARRPFTERDGTVGRVLLAYHNAPAVSRWNGHDLLGIAAVLERLTLDDGQVIESSGPPMIFGAMLRSVLRDGPTATVLSLLGVVLVIGLLVRPRAAAALALATLLLGVVWMLGIAGLCDVRITFLNFIALPITFGIGAEYAVNLVARLREEPQIGRAIASTGSAVALCSWTTIVGYGSLLAAHSRALRGFGAIAILGEIACLGAALVALPAWLAWRRGLQPRLNDAS